MSLTFAEMKLAVVIGLIVFIIALITGFIVATLPRDPLQPRDYELYAALVEISEANGWDPPFENGGGMGNYPGRASPNPFIRLLWKLRTNEIFGRYMSFGLGPPNTRLYAGIESEDGIVCSVYLVADEYAKAYRTGLKQALRSEFPNLKIFERDRSFTEDKAAIGDANSEQVEALKP